MEEPPLNERLMTRYVALLRGINVGGKKMIRMEDLVRVFASLGFKNVRTYIASGNVIFDDPADTAPVVLVKKIEKKLLKSFGHEVAVILRTVDELKALVKRNPFKKVSTAGDVMLFVTFLAAEPKNKRKIPLQSSTENLDVLAIKDRAAFIVARRKRTGWFGYPNNLVEKELAVAATTRNWSTVGKIVGAAD
jgi:uncharacterized protein (DUF1697 family)